MFFPNCTRNHTIVYLYKFVLKSCFETNVLLTSAILIVFEKLTRACFSQIALETILLYTYTNLFWKVVLKLMSGLTSAILIVFEKHHSCMFFPNCTRNHTIVYLYKFVLKSCFETNVLLTSAILIVFEKLTRACFSQIALETILLYTYTNLFWKVVLKLMFFWLVQFW